MSLSASLVSFVFCLFLTLDAQAEPRTALVGLWDSGAGMGR